VPDLANRGPLGFKTGNSQRGTASGKKRMALVASLPCVICGAPPPSQCHHCISGRYSQRKAPDAMTVPLCYNHHLGAEGIHTNKAAWERLHGPDTGFLPLVDRLLSS
jgi:hypothetical protein